MAAVAAEVATHHHDLTQVTKKKKQDDFPLPKNLGFYWSSYCFFYADDSGLGEGGWGVGGPPNISINGKKAILLK